MYSLIGRIVCTNAFSSVRSHLNAQWIVQSSSRRFFNTNFPLRKVIEVDTNIAKDVILFKYENPRYFHLMNICAFTQYIFFNYSAYFCYTNLKDTPVDTSEISNETPLYKRVNLGDHVNKTLIASAGIIVGVAIILVSWMYTLRSVRYLILHKGGTNVTVVTYAPLGKNRMMKLNLKHISCQESRTGAQSQIPLKIQNRILYYLLDKKGEFNNPILFDHTVGIKRKFK